jgi:hypothetical protein
VLLSVVVLYTTTRTSTSEPPNETISDQPFSLEQKVLSLLKQAEIDTQPRDVSPDKHFHYSASAAGWRESIYFYAKKRGSPNYLVIQSRVSILSDCLANGTTNEFDRVTNPLLVLVAPLDVDVIDGQEQSWLIRRVVEITEATSSVGLLLEFERLARATKLVAYKRFDICEGPK